MTDQTQRLPLAYGIWIPGKGWLKMGSRFFADDRPEMARAALKMYDAGLHTNARIELFDESMRDFELLFLEREAEAITRKQRTLLARFMRWLNGILGFLN